MRLSHYYILFTVMISFCLGLSEKPRRRRGILPLVIDREPIMEGKAWDAKTRSVDMHYHRVPVDHFNPRDNRTFLLRYSTNFQFSEMENSPIIIALAGEWPIYSTYLENSRVYELARALGAHMLYVEHRYYGLSQPTSDTAVENLRYLTVEQSLADTASLIKYVKNSDGRRHSKVVVLGSSYSGALATWLRMKYPEVVDGAVSSSGPLLAKSDFYEYLEDLTATLLTYGGKSCVDSIQAGVQEIKRLLTVTGGPKLISDLFKTCTPLNPQKTLDVQTFFWIIIGKFTVLQYSSNKRIIATCSLLSDPENGSPLERLALFTGQKVGHNCYITEYKTIVKEYKANTYGLENISGRLWYYQMCSTFGFFRTTSSQFQAFGDTIPKSYFEHHFCPDIYGKRFNQIGIERGIRKINKAYGGLKPNVTNVAFISGRNDPWRQLSVVEDLSESSPAMVISGEGHCANTRASKDDDSPSLVEAKERILEQIKMWTTPEWQVSLKKYSPPKLYGQYHDETPPLDNVYRFNHRAFDDGYYFGNADDDDYHDSGTGNNELADLSNSEEYIRTEI